MGKSTGFSQSVHGLIQFMGKGTKHPHILYMYLHMRTNTHSTLHLCLWIFPVLTAQVYAVDITQLFSSMLFESAPVPLIGAVSCVCVCVCMQVTSVPSESHSSSPAEVTWAGYICVPTWSFLDLLGLVKGSNGRHTERALSTGAQLCLCVLPAHSLFSLLSVYVCVCAGSWVGTVRLGWPTWAGLLRSESLQENQTGLGRGVWMEHRCKNINFVSIIWITYLHHWNIYR